MNSKYTLIIRDNTNPRKTLEFDVDSIHHQISPKIGTIRVLAYISEEQEEKTPQEYLIDEENFVDEITEKISDCSSGHSLVYTKGLIESYLYCERCGVRK
jgi:hypothetical protein